MAGSRILCCDAEGGGFVNGQGKGALTFARLKTKKPLSFLFYLLNLQAIDSNMKMPYN